MLAHTFDIVGFIAGLQTMGPGDSAQFAAGMLYAGTGQIIDKRDYMLGCFVDNDDLNSQLSMAFDFYNDGDDKNGAKAMMGAIPMYTEAMSTCTESNPYFQKMLAGGQDFTD